MCKFSFLFVKEDFFVIFFSSLNSVRVYANNGMCFRSMASNIAKFGGGKVKKWSWNQDKVLELRPKN